MVIETKADYFASTDDMKVAADAKASFFNIIGTNFKGSLQHLYVNKKFEESSKNVTRYSRRFNWYS